MTHAQFQLSLSRRLPKYTNTGYRKTHACSKQSHKHIIYISIIFKYWGICCESVFWSTGSTLKTKNWQTDKVDISCVMAPSSEHCNYKRFCLKSYQNDTQNCRRFCLKHVHWHLYNTHHYVALKKRKWKQNLPNYSTCNFWLVCLLTKKDVKQGEEAEGDSDRQLRIHSKA